MYVISQVYVIYVAVMLLFPLQMFMYYCLWYPEEGLIVLSRKRSLCIAFNKNVKSNEVAAYYFDKPNILVNLNTYLQYKFMNFSLRDRLSSVKIWIFITFGKN